MTQSLLLALICCGTCTCTCMKAWYPGTKQLFMEGAKKKKKALLETCSFRIFSKYAKLLLPPLALLYINSDCCHVMVWGPPGTLLRTVAAGKLYNDLYMYMYAVCIWHLHVHCTCKVYMYIQQGFTTQLQYWNVQYNKYKG